MAKDGLDGVERLIRKLSAMPKAARKAAGQRAFLEAEEMAAEMRQIAPRDDNPSNGQQVRDHIRVEEGRLGDVSYVVISDAKDAQGRPKAPRVELGHAAVNGRWVDAVPSFYPVVRARQAGVKRRIASAMRRAIRKEAGL
jgi:hypothetical protein